MQKTKYIFITGGVCSGLGKGIASASIGAILKSCGYSVFSLKLDPSPFQHGEVFVTDDGAETDLDLGHYERFIDTNVSRFSNLTTGQVYQRVLRDERRGDFLGKTIQIIPHITDAIQEYINKTSRMRKTDILLIEIGGTVGDIEGEPFLEAVREFTREKGEENVFFVHVTLLPFLVASQELKTKPTQMSLGELFRRGIRPDVVLCRSDYPIGLGERKKIGLFASIPTTAVIPAPTVKSIYEVPLFLEKFNISKIIFDKLQLPKKKPNLKPWAQLVRRVH